MLAMVHGSTTCNSRALTLLLPLILAACSDNNTSGGLTSTPVEGLPQPANHVYAAWEQGDHLLLGSNPWDDGGLFTLDPGSSTAQPVTVQTPVTPFFNTTLLIGEREQVPLFYTGNRLYRYDASAKAIVDLAPLAPFLSGDTGTPQAYLMTLDGKLLVVDGSVQVFDPDSDSWNVVVPEGTLRLRAYTYWDGRIIALSEDGIGELSAEGYTQLATCLEDCEILNWSVLHHPANGDLWIQENYRWWSFDGTEIRSIGPFPNPGADVGEAKYITRVQTAAVLGNRIYSINQERNTASRGTMLSWSPGETSFVEHDKIVMGFLIGSKQTGIVLVPSGRYDSMFALHQ